MLPEGCVSTSSEISVCMIHLGCLAENDLSDLLCTVSYEGIGVLNSHVGRVLV